MDIRLTIDEARLLIEILKAFQPADNGESMRRWALIEKVAKVLPPGAARTWRALSPESKGPRLGEAGASTLTDADATHPGVTGSSRGTHAMHVALHGRRPALPR